jgi:hypothetical protein
MKNLRIYDNGGKSFDRYTIVFLDRPEHGDMLECLAMSENPFHPQGFCQHSMAMLGAHLGKRIRFDQLPTDCQRATMMG